MKFCLFARMKRPGAGARTMPPFAGAKTHRPAWCCLLALLLCACGTRDSAPTIRLASFSPSQGWTVSKVLKPWVAQLNQRFGDAATLELFAGGSLGRHPDAQLKMVAERIVDIAYILPSYTPGAFPDNDLFEIPLLFPSARAASLVSWHMLQRGELRGYSHLKVLALYTTNPYYLHLRRPIGSLGELRGKKIRVTGSLQARTVTALGAIPIGGIAASELADSIDRGLLDGTLLSWDLMHIYGVTQVTHYHIRYPLGFNNLMVAMNPDSYAALSEAVRGALDELSGEPLIERFVEANEQLAEVGYQSAVRAGGHEFAELSSSEALDWRQRLQPLLEERGKKNPHTSQQLRAMRAILASAPAHAAAIDSFAPLH